jgi:chitin synthase
MSASRIQSVPADDNGQPNEVELAGLVNDEHIFQSKRFNIKLTVLIVKVLLFVSVLTCLVFNKLTFIKILADLHNLSNFTNISEHTSTNEEDSSHRDAVAAANLYWMLFFIMLVPNILTWIRSLLYGVLSKSSHSPWPNFKAFIFGILLAFSEAVAESFLVFYIFTIFPPEVPVLLMSGAYIFQSLIQTFTGLYYCRKNNNRRQNNFTPLSETSVSIFYELSKCSLSVIICTSFVGFFFQFSGIVSIAAVIIYKNNSNMLDLNMAVVVTPLCLVLLSFVWSSSVQKLTFSPQKSSNKETARWKASFIATSVRLLTYPIVSYVIFRYLYQLRSGEVVDPWVAPWNKEHSAISDIKQCFQWSNHHISVFVAHIVTSFFGYVLSWLSCYMTLHFYGLVLPILLATPITFGVYFLSNSPFKVTSDPFYLFPFEESDISSINFNETLAVFYCVFWLSFLLWVGHQISSFYITFKAKNAILASDETMFIRPHYNSFFLEQYLSLNRNVSYTSQIQINGRREPSYIFICSTMFRENVTEMEQLLKSIGRVAKQNGNNPENSDRFESHIFFDGGCREDEILPFAVQLISLLPSALQIELAKCRKQKTPYGYRLQWIINDTMPFVIHLKDNLKVRNKKRWSQVMYMDYITNYLQNRDNLNLDNTFILTTDADVDFKAESVLVLLDMLARDSHVGAVCARTHPLGGGPLYWYQIFDYAIGHWLQKSTEHMLGSVLCCPGCFSMFRCSALKSCLSVYSSEVSNATQFLTKDMGEDRWLCTLMVENGWRLEYCAISNDYTYCPGDFDEFFKQRRRWIPSTVANLWLLVTKAGKITSGNESITWAFVLYQILIIISTIISPATVILIISSGLAVFGLNEIGVIVTLTIFAFLYGVVCIYTDQKTQLDIAKILTFCFSILMAVVFVGIFKADIEDIIGTIISKNNTAETANLIPVSENTIYTGLFAFIFITTAILHLSEFFDLIHIIWYLLGLPAGYLLLLIYSTANLNDRRWGTREANDGTQQNLYLIIQASIKKLFSYFKKSKDSDNNPAIHNEDINAKCDEFQMGLEGPAYDDDIGRSRYEYPWLIDWLKRNDSEVRIMCGICHNISSDIFTIILNTWYILLQYYSYITEIL